MRNVEAEMVERLTAMQDLLEKIVTLLEEQNVVLESQPDREKEDWENE
jgi:hypothetical protein